MATLDNIVPLRASLWPLALALLVGAIVAVPASGQQSERAATTAWEELLRRDPAAAEDDSLDALTRRLLHSMTPEQARALADGATPEEIFLEGGETLADRLARAVPGGAGLVYVPVDQCKVFATLFQTAPVTGPMAADEIREFVVRGSGTAHTDQGGAPTCLIPDEAVAVVMHFRVVADADPVDRGFLRAWAADAPEPSTPIVDYEPVVDPPLTPRLRFNGTAILELCPLAGCGGVEIKVKTMQLGGHVRGDVTGFFRPTEAADVPEAGNAQTLGGMDKSTFADAVHTHDGGDIVSGTVGEPYIDSLIARDSEVVDIVKASDGAGSGLDGDTIDGRHADDIKPRFDNCLTVSPSCPAAAAEALAFRCWQTIQAAIDAADPACVADCLPAAASPTNRYVVQVGPGTYTEQVTMIANVDVEGSGQKMTTITNTSTPTLAAASDTALTSLTVEHTDGGTAIQASAASPMIKHVTARATGAGAPKAVELGMGAAPMLTHVTTESDGDGVENNNATVSIRDSDLSGATNAIENTGATPDSSIVNTRIDGGASDGATGATFSCLGAYDATLTELDANCQP